MKIAYYPGCSLEGTAKEYDKSARPVMEKLGVELVEVPDWNCCGATPAHLTHPDLALALPARVLALAEGTGLSRITAPCAACYNRLATTSHKLKDPGLRARINELTGHDYRGEIEIVTLPDLVLDMGVDKIAGHVTRPLDGLKVASYYGCLLVRPQEITGAPDPDNPQSLDTIMRVLGAEPVDWPFKAECCGGSHSLGRSDIVKELVANLVEMAVDNGAECFATACPLCQGNLDMRQDLVAKRMGRRLPVFHFTQLMGLAFGMGEKQMGLKGHLVDPHPVLKASTS